MVHVRPVARVNIAPRATMPARHVRTGRRILIIQVMHRQMHAHGHVTADIIKIRRGPPVNQTQ